MYHSKQKIKEPAEVVLQTITCIKTPKK